MKIWVWLCGGVLVLLTVPLPIPPITEAAPNPAPVGLRGGRLLAGTLGFVGGYLVGRGRGGHRRSGCYNCGCGGCYGGGGCGWCGGGHYGRKRRSIDDVMEREHLEEIYRKVSEEDADECGLRLICELAQRDPNNLTDEETILLLPYRGRDESNEGTYYGQYDKAVWHGQKGNPCHKLYSLCRYPAQIIMELSPNTTSLND